MPSIERYNEIAEEKVKERDGTEMVSDERIICTAAAAAAAAAAATGSGWSRGRQLDATESVFLSVYPAAL